MNAVSRNPILAALVGLTLVGLLFRDVIRDALIQPLISSFWIAFVVLTSIPQIFLWAIFIVIAVVIATASIGLSEEQVYIRPREIQPRGLVAAVAHRIDEANSAPGTCSELALRLEQLTIEVLADQEQIPPEVARERFRSNGFAIPPHVRAYLRTREPAVQPRRRFRRTAPTSPISPDAEEVVLFLEALLSDSREGSA